MKHSSESVTARSVRLLSSRPDSSASTAASPKKEPSLRKPSRCGTLFLSFWKTSSSPVIRKYSSRPCTQAAHRLGQNRLARPDGRDRAGARTGWPSSMTVCPFSAYIGCATLQSAPMTSLESPRKSGTCEMIEE